MKVENPLSREFIQNYPVEAARVLELVSADHVAAFFSELPAQTGAKVMVSMLPEKAAACQAAMTSLMAAKLMTELPVPYAARIYRFLSQAKQNEMAAHLTDKIKDKIKRYLKYPSASAGALLDPKVDTLPETVTVAEAMRRLEHLEHSISCEIYIVDDMYHLVGVLDLGSLLTMKPHSRLRDVMSHKTQPLSVYAHVNTLFSHPGWMTRRKLPVVERDNTLVGVLHYRNLQDLMNETQASISRDPLDNFFSLASLYWISVAQLLDSVLNIAKSDQGDRS